MIHEQVKKWRKIVLFRVRYGMRLGLVDHAHGEWTAEVYPPAKSGLSVETIGSRRPGIHNHYTIVLSDVFKKDKLELMK